MAKVQRPACHTKPKHILPTRFVLSSFREDSSLCTESSRSVPGRLAVLRAFRGWPALLTGIAASIGVSRCADRKVPLLVSRWDPARLERIAAAQLSTGCA